MVNMTDKIKSKSFVTIPISEERHVEIKKESQRLGITMAQFIRQLVYVHLDENKPRIREMLGENK